jgi:hypothetical protein
MVRTQIQLTTEQARRLKELAATEQRSVAELIRISLDEFLRRRGPLDRRAQKARALEAVGRHRSGLGDLATEHDRYLHEAFSE